MTLNQLLSQPELENKLLNNEQTIGFLTAMAAAPHLLDPSDWLAYLWGGDEVAPFETAEQFEQYAELVIEQWNIIHPALLDGSWAWPEGYDLDEEEVVTEAVRDFAEGLLQGWQLTRDDWETLMPEDSEDDALLGGVLLSISMLYDPETAITTLSDQGLTGLDEFQEIYNAIPLMLCGLTQRGHALAQQANH
ncbi:MULTISPECIES: UPF0149 family protein [Vibrio]|uniref:UPF0149 family protein n=1 Tax=Vibrio algicola TaxID=2662262 RepID=A0A5Q0TDF4_9VIBR|nr:UPF0149 family protein [Vibrio algicola]MBD1575389.1 UPF0149 family protein [Vibrio sp. S11_S32]